MSLEHKNRNLFSCAPPPQRRVSWGGGAQEEKISMFELVVGEVGAILTDPGVNVRRCTVCSPLRGLPPVLRLLP